MSAVPIAEAELHALHAQDPEPARRPRSAASWSPHRRREWLAKPDARQLPLCFGEPETAPAAAASAALDRSPVRWAEEAVRAVLILAVILGGMLL